jgi:glycosyltransferase involved in cell wall biosynthesis
MRIVYHHRTRSTDAQRIHIQEIVRAFEELGHQVNVAGLVPLETGQEDAARDAGEAAWKRLARRIPYAYEAAQLAYNLVGVPMLLKSALKVHADFIYERYALYNFAGAIVARLLRIPLVLEVNSPFALEQARDGDIRGLRFARWAEASICNQARMVIVVSTPLARLMEAAGVEPRKLAVMSNGVALNRFEPQPREKLRRQMGLDGAPVIGFVGWFRNWHGLEMLIDVFAQSGLAAHGVKVMLIGDGPAMPDLRAAVAAHQLAGSVIFTGPLPHEAVPAYLDLIDIAVQPAANEYCCPMKIIEYMALGKAIVAPRQENITELLREDEEALYFAPGDAEGLGRCLTALAGSAELRRRIGASARAAVSRRGFSWRANAQRVIDLVASGQIGDGAVSRESGARRARTTSPKE